MWYDSEICWIEKNWHHLAILPAALYLKVIACKHILSMTRLVINRSLYSIWCCMDFEILSMRKSNNILRFGSRGSTWSQGVNCAGKANTETKVISLRLAWAQLSSVADIFCKVAWPHSVWTLKWGILSNWLSRWLSKYAQSHQMYIYRNLNCIVSILGKTVVVLAIGETKRVSHTQLKSSFGLNSPLKSNLVFGRHSHSEKQAVMELNTCSGMIDLVARELLGLIHDHFFQNFFPAGDSTCLIWD